jgi:predicted dehydrogenase
MPAGRPGDRLRIGLAGAGRFGALHLRALDGLPVEVAALCDPAPARAAEVAARHGVPRRYPTLAELLRSEEVDLVDVVSDEASHAELAAEALEAGRHVFVEKPLALSTAGAERLAALAADRDRTVVTGQISRFGAPYAHVRAVLDSGELGRVVALRLRRDFSRDWFTSFGDRVHPVWESGIHDIDLAVWWAGAPCTRVRAVARSLSGRRHPDTFSSILEFANGVVATIESAWLVPRGAPQTLKGALELDGTIDASAEVLCERGTVKQRLVSDGLGVWTDDGVVHPETILWPTVHGRISGALRDELAYAVEVARGERPHDVIPLDQAVEGIRIAEAVERAARTGETVELGAGVAA